MDREDRTAEASASSGSCDFKSWLSYLAQKGGKNGSHTKQELEVVRGLLEADAAANGHAPLAALLPCVREAYHKDRWSSYRSTFKLVDGILLKLRTRNRQPGWHPVCPLEGIAEVLHTIHSIQTAHNKSEAVYAKVSRTAALPQPAARMPGPGGRLSGVSACSACSRAAAPAPGRLYLQVCRHWGTQYTVQKDGKEEVLSYLGLEGITLKVVEAFIGRCPRCCATKQIPKGPRPIFPSTQSNCGSACR